MSNTNIKALNKITKKLIDTKYGYTKGAELMEDDPIMAKEFQRRGHVRSQFVNDFQTAVKTLGGEPETDGTMTGRIHEGFTKFSAMFRDDKKAALDAIDDAEEMLADDIKDTLEDKDLALNVRQMMTRAYQEAKEGERFADIMEKRAA